MLDVKRLRVLREVATQGSFSAAGEALSYSQSAVSQHVAALERETGTQLVERRPREVRLTDAGRALVRHADRVLAALADAEAELAEIADGRRGSVRLATFPSAGASLVPQAIATFRERHPGIEVEVEVAEAPDGLAGVRARDFDVALVIEDDEDPRPEGVDMVHVLDDPHYLVLPQGSPLATRKRLRLADLAEESWILGQAHVCPDNRNFLNACRAAGFEPKAAFYSDDYTAMQGFIAAGVGVAVIPELALVTVRGDVVVRDLAETPYRRILAATLEGERSPAVEVMVDTLREAGARYPRTRAPLSLAS
jgi:DNA-binding transcriptional LysR family regulator